MTTAPLIFQIHATASWLIWNAWPFARLVVDAPTMVGE